MSGAGGPPNLLVVSLRSKGIASVNRRTCLDLRHQVLQFTGELADVFKAALITFACLSWTAWISIGVSIIAVSTIINIQIKDLSGADSSIVLPFFAVIILPLLGLVVVSYQRRNRAYEAIAQLKASLTALSLNCTFIAAITAAEVAAEGGDTSRQGNRQAGGAAVQGKHGGRGQQRQHASSPAVLVGVDLGDDEGTTPQQYVASACGDLRQTIATLLDDLHRYLAHKRPYARHFFGPLRASERTATDSLFTMTRELGLLLRRVHRSVRQLHMCAHQLRHALYISAVTSMSAQQAQLSSGFISPHTGAVAGWQQHQTPMQAGTTRAPSLLPTGCTTAVQQTPQQAALQTAAIEATAIGAAAAAAAAATGPGNAAAGGNTPVGGLQGAGAAAGDALASNRDTGVMAGGPGAVHMLQGSTAGGAGTGGTGAALQGHGGTGAQAGMNISGAGAAEGGGGGRAALQGVAGIAGLNPMQLHAAPHMAALGGLAPGLLSSTVGGGGTGWADGALLGQQVTKAHEAVEQLVGCKELRSPVVIRALVRWYAVVILPAFLSYYWAGVAANLGNALGAIMMVLFQIAMMSLLDVAVALEDPFDEAALDGLSCFELLDQMAALTSEGPESEGLSDLGGPTAMDLAAAYYMPAAWQHGGQRDPLYRSRGSAAVHGAGSGDPEGGGGGGVHRGDQGAANNNSNTLDTLNGKLPGDKGLHGLGSSAAFVMPPMPLPPQAALAAAPGMMPLGMVGATRRR